MNTAYFACGCFWGVQYQFSRLNGVKETYTGYMGGQIPSPTYQDVCTGSSGYKETVKIAYDPQIIDYISLLQFFFEIHNFQQTDGQGPDIGDQYLSVIFTSDATEKKQAGQMLGVLKNMGYRPATQILPAGQFWPAEDYHQHYYEITGQRPYCHLHRRIFDRVTENGEPIMPTYQNLDQCIAFKKLQNIKPVILKDVLNAQRVQKYQAKAGAGLTYNYAAKAVDENILNALCDLAREQQLIEKYRCVLNGETMNTGENRKVLHHLCRGQLGQDVVYEGQNLRQFYVRQQKCIADFSQRVHQGDIKGSSGKVFDTVVQIGIGGSDLGPRALYLALENLYTPKMRVHFISNVDPDDANATLQGIDLESTLFIVVSKSGTTQETLTNYHFVLEMAKGKKISGLNIDQHIIAVTSQSSPMAKNLNFAASFFIDDFIGGRYSSTSAVGGAVLSLAFGSNIFDQILQGAHEADKQAMNENALENAALLDALIGVYERNILQYPCTAILPYSQALSRFPAHLQQLDMESNGKSVNREKEKVHYTTGPIILGEPGTNGQHSFYQSLHQGTDIVPLQFIGFCRAQINADVQYEGSSSQMKLNANLLAQILAFALGKEDSDANKSFAGNRPGSLLYAQRLDARVLGALLAHFENKVMFQGFAWNINSFDQEGVQLGKILTNKILQKQTDDLSDAFMALLDL